MTSTNSWDRAIGLTNRVFQVTSGLDLPRGNQWPTVVTVFLTQAHERLDSIRVLLDKGYWDSSVVLTRSLFELTVNLAYLAEDMPARLPEYLQHGGIPTTIMQVEELQAEIEQGDCPEVVEIVPGQAWRTLRGMCTELGLEWVREYETFYRYASVPTHAGSFTLGKSYSQLLKQELPSDGERAVVLVTTLVFHLRVVKIAATVFPTIIGPEAVQQLRTECQDLGQSLTQR